MKIVIDIPERDYDLACKYPNALIATYAHYIKDGIPYEERPQGVWISTGDRLPENMDNVLVTIQVGNRKPVVRSGFYACGLFNNDNGDVWNWNDPEVKAWMLQPVPYKEAENE